VRNLVLSGGVAHDFAATSAAVAGALAEVGVESVIRDDLPGALTGLDGFDLVTVNLLRWRMDVDRYAHLRAEWALTLDEPARRALLGHVRRGGGLLALHTAPICFDDWPGWGRLVGAAWDWERSSHPPLGPARITVHTDAHEIVAGIGDFDVVDEVYGFLRLEPGIAPLMTATHGGAEHPLLWARQVGRGRVVYDALGHHPPSYTPTEHRTIVQRAARWAAGTARVGGLSEP
jgi:type 1 glutamine amidotransferase